MATTTVRGSLRSLVAILTVTGAAFAGCGGGSGGPKGHPDGGASCEADPALATANAAELFDPAAIPVFDFYLPEETWEYLKANARDEQYVEAEACFNGKAVGRVGLRFKGAYGSLYNCFTPAGENICRKLGMKVKFDEYDEGRRFYGLKRLNFQGNRYDGSYLKEKLSYEAYREMGIVAPRASWALLRVNAEEQGLFGMVEQVDGRFTDDRWPADGDGNLYKEVWPGETDEGAIAAALETNEETGDVARFLAFSQALAAAASPAEMRAALGQYMDLEHFARYMAVDDAIANFDGIITYYTSGAADQAGNHNFFFYETSDGRFTLIPWDLESTFSLVSGYGSVPTWQETPADCSLTYPVWNGRSRVVAPGCDRVFKALAADLTAYRAAARELLDGPFAVQPMLAKVDRHAGFIRAAAAADPHGPGAAQFEQEVGFLKKQIPELRRRLEHLVSGKPSTPLVLDVERVGDFETADSFGVYSGTSLLSNAASTVSVDVNASQPIAGAQSLRISFDFRNESVGWQQWMFYTVPLATVPGDLTGKQGIRFKVRASAPRVLRVELDSPGNSRANEGVKVGWDLMVSTGTTELSVMLAEARVPSWAADPGDSLTAILRTVTGLSFKPECTNRDGSGQIPAGTTDSGWVDLDDVVFF